MWWLPGRLTLNTLSGEVFMEKVAEKTEGKAHIKGSHADAVEPGMGLGDVPHFGCP